MSERPSIPPPGFVPPVAAVPDPGDEKQLRVYARHPETYVVIEGWLNEDTHANQLTLKLSEARRLYEALGLVLLAEAGPAEWR